LDKGIPKSKIVIAYQPDDPEISGQVVWERVRVCGESGNRKI